MPILGALVLLIQFCFAYHVLKSGRPYWWMFIIMAFPVMGCVIYYFVEVFPGSREHRKALKAARAIARAVQPDAELKKRVEELAICGSLDNRMALAAECMNHRMYAEAARLYESCLEGAYANDGGILFGLARAAVEGGDWRKAEAALGRLKTAAPRLRPLEARLLQARVHEGVGDYDAALAVYREILPAFVGLEARYRYARLLLRLGRRDAAMEMFDEVVQHARRFASSIEGEEQWAAAARQAIGGR
jgi:hypothetical protein